MKGKILFFGLVMFISHHITWAQSASYGGLQAAGTNGAINNSYFGHQASFNNTQIVNSAAAGPCPEGIMTTGCNDVSALIQAYTHTASANGNWNDPNSWANGQVPGDDATVAIPDGITITVTHPDNARIKFIKVEGELKMEPLADTQLKAETIYIAPAGSFRIGYENTPVASGKTAKVIFISNGSPIDTNWDNCEISRGLIAKGSVKIYGQPKTNMTEMKFSIKANRTVMDLKNTIPADWTVGDSIVLTGTHFKRNEDFQDEKFRIVGTSGTQITISPATQHDHLRINTSMNLHVANLTRNVIFQSESAEIPLRGHIMFMNPDVDVRHAAFIDLGRTNKDIPLDDVIVNPDGSTCPPISVTNRRARYPVHFHHNGPGPDVNDPPSKVYGCVVQGTPGWGYVNHSSHVDFQNNVCHDFTGSAFVTEAGDELGNFFNNIAIHGTGSNNNGNNPKYADRMVFNSDNRPQPLSDFGFRGEGFWFQGPAIRVSGNVANSCNGSGMIWFTTGAVNPETNQYTGFNRSLADQVYAAYPDYASLVTRYWNYDPDALVISDLPILECSDFQAYGCFIGFRLRFNNHNNVAFYGESGDKFGYLFQLNTPANVLRIDQQISNLRLWNNEQGLKIRYSNDNFFENVTIDNRASYFYSTPEFGADFFHAANNLNFDGLSISGYAIAGMLKTGLGDNSLNVHLTNYAYFNYANADSWTTPSIPDPPSCPRPDNLAVNAVSATTATLSWVNAIPDSTSRFLIRYRKASTPKWQFYTDENPADNSVTLTGLSENSTYEYQVISGCADTVSWWSEMGGFTTDPAVGSKTAMEVNYQEENNYRLAIYPNPVEGDELYVTANEDSKITRMEIYDMQGKLIMQYDNIEQGVVNYKLDISMIRMKGMYLIKIYDNKEVNSLRFIR